MKTLREEFWNDYRTWVHKRRMDNIIAEDAEEGALWAAKWAFEKAAQMATTPAAHRDTAEGKVFASDLRTLSRELDAVNR